MVEGQVRAQNMRAFSRPFGTSIQHLFVPGCELPGYFHFDLRGERRESKCSRLIPEVGSQSESDALPDALNKYRARSHLSNPNSDRPRKRPLARRESNGLREA